MVFFGKLGGLLRRNTAQSVLSKSGLGVAAPALLVLQRGISSSKLYIGGLASETDENTLRAAFGSFGSVIEVGIIVDREGRSKGSAVVNYSSPQEAEAALQGMDGRIQIGYARDSPFGVAGDGYGNRGRYDDSQSGLRRRIQQKNNGERGFGGSFW